MPHNTKPSGVPDEMVLDPLAASDSGSDYTDAFAAAVPAGHPSAAEDWARACFEGASRPVQSFLRIGWRFGLGLQLGPHRSPRHVIGWEIVERGPTSLVMGQASSLLTARIAFSIGEGQLTQVTFVRYDRPIARLIWMPVSVVHRLVVPRLLRRAVRHGIVRPLS